jgi:hypothetical protein
MPLSPGCAASAEGDGDGPSCPPLLEAFAQDVEPLASIPPNHLLAGRVMVVARQVTFDEFASDRGGPARRARRWRRRYRLGPALPPLDIASRSHGTVKHHWPNVRRDVLHSVDVIAAPNRTTESSSRRSTRSGWMGMPRARALSSMPTGWSVPTTPGPASVTRESTCRSLMRLSTPSHWPGRSPASVAPTPVGSHSGRGSRRRWPLLRRSQPRPRRMLIDPP